MVFSVGTIYNGDTGITTVMRGDYLFWASPPFTIVEYSGEGDVEELYSGSPWYNDVIYNGRVDGGNSAVIFRGVQTTFYRLFKNNSNIRELTIPECITTISGNTVFQGLGNIFSGCILTSKPNAAPALTGSNMWNNAYILEFNYPDDSDYVSWFLPGFTGGTEVTYDIETDGGGRSILNGFKQVQGLETWNERLYPQFVRYKNSNTYGPYIPTVTSGWDGNYVGSAYVTNGDEGFKCYVFDKKIVNVPSRAFYNWCSAESDGAWLMFPDCTETIGSEAFRGAKLAQIPRFRGAKTIGNYALYGTGLKVMDLPNQLESIGNYCFPTTTERINAYNDIQTVGTLSLPSTGVLAYEWWAENTALRNAVPAGWTKQGVDTGALWPMQDSCVVFDATSNTLTITIELYNSTESWEDGYFYIMDSDGQSQQLAYIDYYEHSKTVTYPVQSGNRYYIYYDYNSSQSPGWQPNLVSGGNVVALQQRSLYYNAQTANIQLTVGFGFNGDKINYNNPDYRFGYNVD